MSSVSVPSWREHNLQRLADDRAPRRDEGRDHRALIAAVHESDAPPLERAHFLVAHHRADRLPRAVERLPPGVGVGAFCLDHVMGVLHDDECGIATEDFGAVAHMLHLQNPRETSLVRFRWSANPRRSLLLAHSAAAYPAVARCLARVAAGERRLGEAERREYARLVREGLVGDGATVIVAYSEDARDGGVCAALIAAIVAEDRAPADRARDIHAVAAHPAHPTECAGWRALVAAGHHEHLYDSDELDAFHAEAAWLLATATQAPLHARMSQVARAYAASRASGRRGDAREGPGRG